MRDDAGEAPACVLEAAREARPGTGERGGRALCPHAEVLAGCGLALCHGGFGTMLAALGRAVPVAIVSQGADQYRDRHQPRTPIAPAWGGGVEMAAPGERRRTPIEPPLRPRRALASDHHRVAGGI